MNRKGDLPTILVFIVALVLVISSLVIFVGFKGGHEALSSEFSSAVSELNFYRDYVYYAVSVMTNKAAALADDKNFAADFRTKLREIAVRSYVVEGAEDFISKIKKDEFTVSKDEFTVSKDEFTVSKDEFTVSKDGVIYILRVENVLVEAGRGGNLEIRDAFNVSLRFNENGVLAE